MDITSLPENVDILFRSLESFTQNEGVIGKPVIQGDKTFLPVVSITVGYGGGNTSGKSSTSSSSSASMGATAGGGALGMGAKLSTEAVIVIENQNVSMLPMNATAASSLVDKIPQIISGMSQSKGSAPQGGQSSGGMGQ